MNSLLVVYVGFGPDHRRLQRRFRKPSLCRHLVGQSESRGGGSVLPVPSPKSRDKPSLKEVDRGRHVWDGLNDCLVRRVW